MATKQTDAVAMTEEQLDAVAGGWVLKNVQVVSAVKRMRRRSNGTTKQLRITNPDPSE